MATNIQGLENLTPEEQDELICAARWLQCGQLFCICTACLSCVPYFCCYHKRFIMLSLKASMPPAQPSSMGEDHSASASAQEASKSDYTEAAASEQKQEEVTAQNEVAAE